MSVVFPGNGVLDLMRSAAGPVLIAAPYIKSSTIRRLLEAVPDTIPECTCITRWLPEDIASGVCDLEILDDISQVIGGRLFVHPHLHAKYYSNGRQSLVGSANLTARGLGWHTPSNIELLVTLPADFPGLVEWEAALLNSAIEATAELREQVRAQAEQLGPLSHVPEVEDEVAEEDETEFWVPRCPTPERLWEVYRGRGADTMVSSAFEAAQQDLAALSPPPGLKQHLFTAYLSGILRRTPLLVEIDQLASTGLTDTKANELFAYRLGGAGSRGDFGQIWHVVKQWLVHFFPEEYLLETGQEVLVKGRELPRH